MKRIPFLIILILLLLPLCVLALLDIPDGAVMEATQTPSPHGEICIPEAGVNAGLVLVHDDCTCCYLGLWNGGRIYGDAKTFESVKVGDWADIYQPEVHLVLECVEIKHTLSAFVKADGDVLVCVKTAFPLVLRVYRFVRL